MHGKLSSENWSDLEWLQQVLAPSVFSSEHNTSRKSQVETETLTASLVTGWNDADADFYGGREQTLSVPSGFSLRVWADRDCGSHHEQWRGLWLEQVCGAPAFSSTDSISTAEMCPCYCGLKCFWGGFLEKVLHAQGELQNQQYFGTQKVIYSRVQLRCIQLQKVWALWAGGSSHSYDQEEGS